MRGEAKAPMFLCESISFITVKKELKKEFLKKFKKSIDKTKLFCYNIDCSARWCGSMAEQLICNQQVDGSTPFTSSNYMGEFPSGQRGQTVNLLSLTSLVRIQLPPPYKKPTLVVGFLYGVRSKASHQALALQVLLVRIPRAERVELARKRQARVSSPKANTQLPYTILYRPLRSDFCMVCEATLRIDDIPQQVADDIHTFGVMRSNSF